MWWLAFLVALFGAGTSNAHAVVRTFSSKNGAGLGRFNHLVVNKVTGQIYVGAVDQLYHLTQDLDLLQTELTGPRFDFIDCLTISCSGNPQFYPSHDHNKVILIDYFNDKLITCGSVYNGSCTIRSLQDISIVEQTVTHPVVSNNEDSSTLAIIAPGPSNTHIMYVGTTFAGNSGNTSQIVRPGIVSRSLDKDRLFQIVNNNVNTSGTHMFVDENLETNYTINYVYGFTSEGFSYFLTTQGKTINDTSPYISKLVRICQNDPNYYSYTEIPITCNSNSGKQYNLVQAGFVGEPGSDLAKDMGIKITDDVLFAVFAESVNNFNHDLNSSALCVYSLDFIRQNFMKTLKACFSGHGNKGLEFTSGGIYPCVKTKDSVDEYFCGNKENHPLSGDESIKSTSVLNLSVRVTAVAATSTGDTRRQVVFIGTETGHLKKVLMKNSSHATEYDSVVIDEGTVISNLHMDLNATHIYAMTKRLISKVKLQDCEVFKTCMNCRKDPYCEWCTFEDKCTNRSMCRVATNTCNGITSVTRNNTQQFDVTVEKMSELYDAIKLPSPTKEIRCILTFPNKPTRALIGWVAYNRSTIACLISNDNENKLLTIQPKLTLSTKNEPWVFLTTTTNVQFDQEKNCDEYSNCIECTSSGSHCSWFHKEYCWNTDSGDFNSISDPSFCPRIQKANSNSNEILVPDNTFRSIEVSINRTNKWGTHFFDKTQFEFRFDIEGTKKQVNTNFLMNNDDNVLTCDPMEFSYKSRLSNINASLSVYFDTSKQMDNPDNVHVNIYRCRDLATNCGLCLTLNAKYECGWCESRNSCEIFEHCHQTSIQRSWLNRTDTCSSPEITLFEPNSSPLEGGTNVTIHSINLGKTFDDIKDSVSVAGIPCHPYESLYQPTTQIVCHLGGIETIRKGPITVKIGEQYVQSKDNFEIVDPVIRSINPLQGPRSGGTILNITGSNMNTGSRIVAFIDELPCHIINNNNELVQCVTSMSDRQRNGTLTMKFDNGTRLINGSFYKYWDDPTIQSVESGIQFGQGMKYPKGTPAGGTTIDVVGTNLQFIVHPLIYVVYKGKYYSSSCQLTSNITQMKCAAPNINDIKEQLTHEIPLQLEYGFLMDNVSSVQNLSSKLNNSYLLYPNPVYNILGTIEINQEKNESLILKGQHLDLASQRSDLVVKIGRYQFCNITSITRNNLICKPPAEQLLNNNMDDVGIDLPDVTIFVGNLEVKIGTLSYFHPPDPTEYGYTDVISILLLFIIYITLLAAYRHSSTKNVRIRKIMEKQINSLESRVASECREAFAELQIEMTNMTKEIITKGMPFLEYKRYAWTILFPNSENYRAPQFQPFETKYKEKLHRFHQLILNQTFLLNFIRTLESNRNFSMSDRVKVASLVMLVLQSHMKYCSDVLTTLLSELIKKNVQGKSNPKLFLRRTECVAEKMLSSWFTILLYKFLRECAGEPLYMLFRAMKQHLDKGPVDAITGEARYSLSDSKFICNAIDFKPMTVSVSIDCITNAFEVKVLDCDTISQVKEKTLDIIYGATSYSKRPTKIDDYDVELKSSGAVLSDFDKTTKEVGGWKKMNTLKHYKVPDGACLNLVLKHKQSMSRQQIETKSSPIRERADFAKKWHISKRNANNNDQKKEENGFKMVSEIYLMRLMATKGTLQPYVDNLFEAIFCIGSQSSALSFSIKYMFDFLDKEGIKHHIKDPDVVHIWKTNALPLRFWVNLIKNPNFVFDIHKSNIVDSCLSVVAQTFMDSCGTSDPRLSKSSSISKLLYAKDIPAYKEKVYKYYQHIKSMETISDDVMSEILEEESRHHQSDFNTDYALYELYAYACKYNDQLSVTLKDDKTASTQFLGFRLQEVHKMI